ncbi:hypothetical protein ACFY7C_19245 [Streptomyces sp. NPDC012769]|uniref:hypothetical protein n=1 Tax=Streptomyces sp. NPDC012769 TaxID=3364848 RepID=UPI00369B72CC
MSDGVDFNDPRAWGYCKFCVFQVAVDLETQQIFEHDRMYHGNVRHRCDGSLTEASVQPALEVESAASREVVDDE